MRSRHLLTAALLLFGLVLPWLPAAEEDLPPGLLTTLKGHKEAVYGIAFTPDGKFVLTTSGDPSVKVWDAASGKEIKSFAGANGHKQLVLSVSPSPDGTQFATSAGDNSVRIWDFPLSKHIREFPHDAKATTCAVSPDGNRLASADEDGLIRLWNLADPKAAPIRLPRHTGAVTHLAFSPNGQTLVSTGADQTVRFWNAADGKLLSSFAGHTAAITGVAFSPNNNFVATTSQDGTVKFWALPPVASRSMPAFEGPVSALALSPDGAQTAAAAGTNVRLFATATGQMSWQSTSGAGAVTSVSTSPGGTLVAATTDKGRMIVWQPKDGKVLQQAVPHAKGVAGISFSPTGDRLASAGQDGTVKIWAMPAVPTRAYPHPDVVRAAVLAGDKRIVTGGADKVVRIWDVANLKTPERQFSGHTAPVTAVASSADGQTIASGGEAGSVRFWNRTKGEQTGSLGAHASAVTSLLFTPSGQVLSSSLDGTIKLWQVPAPAGKGILAHGAAVTGAALSPDGAKLATGCADKQVRLWNTASGAVEKTFAGPTLAVQCVALSAKGDRVAGGSADKSLWVWDTSTAKEARKLLNLSGAVQAVAFSPDGKLVAAGLADGAGLVLDLAAGKEVASFKGHKGAINALTFTVKGDQVISAGADGVVRLWGAADGAEKSAIKVEQVVTALALSKDGATLATGSPDRSVKLWTLADGKPAGSAGTPAGVNGLSFAPDGKTLAVAGADGKARVLAPDGTLQEYLSHEQPVSAVAFAPDGKRVFTTSADKTARIWTLSLVWQAKGEGVVRKLIATPRGAVAVGDDGNLTIRNIADGKVVVSRKAHDKGIVDVACSPDGNRLVTVAADRTGHLWDLTSKTPEKPAASFTVPGAPASVALSPNGLRIAVGVAAEKESKEKVVLFDGKTAQELTVLGEDEGAPSRALAFLPDSRTLLGASADRTAALIDVNLVSSFEAHAGGVAGLAFTTTGTQLLTGGADKALKLWDLATGKVVKTFGPLEEAVSVVALARDNTQVAGAAGKKVRVFAVADGKQVLELAHPEKVTGVSFSADKTRIATGAADGRARVWDVATKREVQGFLHGAGVTLVAYSPASPAQVIAGGADRTVAVQTLTAQRTLAVGGSPAGLAIGVGGAQVAVACSDGKVRQYNTGTGNLDRTLEAGDKPVLSVAYSRNNLLLAAGDSDAKVRIFSQLDGKLLSSITAPGAVRSLGFSQNNQGLVGACADGSLVIWDVNYAQGQPIPAEFGKVVQTYQHAAADLSFPATAPVFYSAGSDKLVKEWKLSSDAPTRTLNFPNVVTSVVFNPAGTEVATGCGDGRVRVYELAKGALVKDIPAHATPNLTSIYGVAWSPDGKQVVSAGLDHTLKLSDVATGKVVREFKGYKEKEFPRGHQEAVLSVCFSPDGKFIASGGMDKTIKIWNVSDGTVVRELVNPAFKPAAAGLPAPAHPGWVYALRWTKDGKLVSAGGAPRLHGYLAVWDAATGKLLEGRELAVGTIFSLAVSDDGKLVALGTGGSVRSGADLNQGVVLKMPGIK